MKYIDNEIQEINQDRLKQFSPRASKSTFIRFLAMLLFFAFYAATTYASDTTLNICGNGACWICEKCGIRQWQDSNKKNWKGEYHCVSCGAKK